jgi:MarR family transcriptional regulator, lower aerobic nicotinate degradation pathway regulator
VSDHDEPRALLDMTTYLLSRVARLGKRTLDARLAERGLRLRHVAVLAAAAESGPTGQLTLGRHVRLDPSDVTATVDDLVAAGLVTRDVDPADRRRRLVTPTEAGRRTLVEVRTLAAEVADELLAPLDAERRRQLHRDLRTVLDAAQNR